MIQWLENHLTTCFFKSNIGVDCPGCGMQRALISLLKGNFSESFHHHPALIPFLLTLLLLIIQLKVKHNKGASFIVWMFMITTFITIFNYTIKLYFLFDRN